MKIYEQHLKETIRLGKSSTTYEQLAHPHYLESYLEDYMAFLGSKTHAELVESKPADEALNLPLNIHSWVYRLPLLINTSS